MRREFDCDVRHAQRAPVSVPVSFPVLSSRVHVRKAPRVRSPAGRDIPSAVRQASEHRDSEATPPVKPFFAKSTHGGLSVALTVTMRRAAMRNSFMVGKNTGELPVTHEQSRDCPRLQ